MSTNMKNILIIGASSGLGEGFARRFHTQGANLIITGRRADRLNAIKADLEKDKQQNKINTVVWDIKDFTTIQATVTKILHDYPNLDTVFVNAGVMNSFSWLDASTSTNDSIINEVTTNVTAPLLLARAFLPYLASRASLGQHSAFLVTSSGLAFVPAPMYPVYPGTKSAIHYMLMCLRMQVSQSTDENIKKYLSITEIIPPYVDTDLDQNFRERVNKQMDGKMPKPMELQDYLDQTMEKLNQTQENGKLKWEVGTGSAEVSSGAWRKTFGPILEGRGMQEV